MRVVSNRRVGVVRAPLAVSSDGRLVAVCDDDALHVFSAETLAGVRVLRVGPARRRPLCFSPDGAWMLSGRQTLGLFDTRSFRRLLRLKGHSHGIHDAVFSADGRRVFTASGEVREPTDWTVRCWEAASGVRRWKWRGERPVVAVAVSPDGARVAAADDEGRLVALTASGGEVLWRSESRMADVSLGFLADGSLCVGGACRELLHVDVVGLARRLPVPVETRRFVVDGGDAVLAFEARRLVTVRVASGQTAVSTLPVDDDVQALGVSADGSRLYVVTGGGQVLSLPRA